MQSHTLLLENGDILWICSLDDISYTIKPDWDENRSFTFLAYCVQGEEKAFTHVPYDDIRFFTTVRHLAKWSIPCFVLVEESMKSVDLHMFKQTILARALAEHPVWCLVANFRRERPYGPEGQTTVPGGTRHFAPGAKVYCLPPDRGNGYETVPIIARHRVSHRYITAYTNSAWLENWRVKLVYEPVLVSKLLGYWDWTTESRELAEQLVKLGASHARPFPSQ
jgi:hypothetical protein